jgi:hypothetical protein
MLRRVAFAIFVIGTGMPVWAADSPTSDGLLEQFEAICLSTNAEPDAAVIAATNKGWQPLSAEQTGLMSKSVLPIGATQPHGLHLTTVGNNKYLMLASSVPHFFPANPGNPDIHGSVCNVSIEKSGEPGLDRQISSLLEMSAVPFNGKPTYIWHIVNGKRFAIDPNSNSKEFTSAMGNGGVYFLVASSEGPPRITMS